MAHRFAATLFRSQEHATHNFADLKLNSSECTIPHRCSLWYFGSSGSWREVRGALVFSRLEAFLHVLKRKNDEQAYTKFMRGQRCSVEAYYRTGKMVRHGDTTSRGTSTPHTTLVRCKCCSLVEKLHPLFSTLQSSFRSDETWHGSLPRNLTDFSPTDVYSCIFRVTVIMYLVNSPPS